MPQPSVLEHPPYRGAHIGCRGVKNIDQTTGKNTVQESSSKDRLKVDNAVS